MWTPPKRVCDMCLTTPLPTNDDSDGPQPAFVLLPIPDDERVELARAISENIPEPFRMLGSLSMNLPTHYRLEFCMGCVEGFMPMIEDLRKKGFASEIVKMRRRVAKARREELKDDASTEDTEP